MNFLLNGFFRKYDCFVRVLHSKGTIVFLTVRLTSWEHMSCHITNPTQAESKGSSGNVEPWATLPFHEILIASLWDPFFFMAPIIILKKNKKK